MMWVQSSSGIKSMCVQSQDCLRVKGRESECPRTESGVRQDCIVSPWLFNVYMDVVIKEVKVGMGRMGVRFREERR